VIAPPHKNPNFARFCASEGGLNVQFIPFLDVPAERTPYNRGEDTTYCRKATRRTSHYTGLNLQGLSSHRAFKPAHSRGERLRATPALHPQWTPPPPIDVWRSFIEVSGIPHTSYFNFILRFRLHFGFNFSSAVLYLKIYYRPPQLTLHRQAHLRPTREARKVRSSSPPAYAIFKLQAALHPKLRTRLHASLHLNLHLHLNLNLHACSPMSKDILQTVPTKPCIAERRMST